MTNAERDGAVLADCIVRFVALAGIYDDATLAAARALVLDAVDTRLSAAENAVLIAGLALIDAETDATYDEGR